MEKRNFFSNRVGRRTLVKQEEMQEEGEDMEVDEDYAQSKTD